MPISEQVMASVWALGVAAAGVFVIWLLLANGWKRPVAGDAARSATPPAPVEPVQEFPEGLGEGQGPVPLFIKLLSLTFVVWAIGYVAVFMMNGAG